MYLAVGVVFSFLAVLFVGLWLLGGRQQVFRAEVRIGAAPETVFPWLTEPALLKRWIGGFVESIPQGDARLRVGARSTELIEENGRTTEMSSEILVLQHARKLEVALSSPQLSGINDLTLEPLGDAGTRVRQRLTVRYRGVTRLFGPLLAHTVREKLRSDLERLRAGVESAGSVDPGREASAPR